MGRKPRVDVGGYPYHILNRANARLPIFFEEEGYRMFEHILRDACDLHNMRVLAYCLMPNHFHLVAYPKKDGDMGRFMQWLVLTHTQRWHAKHETVGTGHLYQGRYKSVLVQDDAHLLGLIRYVERNPLRAKLVKNLTNWKFSSYWRRMNGNVEEKRLLADWPISIPRNYGEFVHTPSTTEELGEIRSAVQTGLYGSESWTDAMRKKFNVAVLKKAGRPKSGG